MKKWASIVLVTLLCGFAARADGEAEWKSLGQFSADGKAKQLEPLAALTECRLVGVQGKARIYTLVVRTGEEKKALRVARVLKAGEEVRIALEVSGEVTVLRISDGGGGSYEVFVR